MVGNGNRTVRERFGWFRRRFPRGTEVVLHLKDDCKDFAEDWKLTSVIKRYSGYVPHPVKVGGEVVNSLKPIWVEPKSQVSDEQYRQFYQHLTHGGDESPLWHLHFSADSPIQFNAILYCPSTNVELLGFGRQEHGLSLCAKRVLVQQDCRELLPEYLRFLYGIVDSEDLPLNVSRETLQDNSVIRRIRNTLVKAVFDRLQKFSEESPKDYLTFYRQFGTVFKEGVGRRPDEPGPGREVAPVHDLARRRSGRPRVARRIHSARSRRAQGDLLSRWSRPLRDQKEPELRSVPASRSRGHLPERSGGRVRLLGVGLV